MRTNEDLILVADAGVQVFVKIVGRGSHQNSAQVKHVAKKGRRIPFERLIIDLSECVSMDSTFMGVLVSLSADLRETQCHPLSLINLSAKLDDLARTLGLNHIVDLHGTGTPLPAYAENLTSTDEMKEDQATLPTNPDASRELVREAHEALSELSETNRLRFKSVLEYLDEDLSDD
jgi:anti-anti-sigma regulatory factor